MTELRQWTTHVAAMTRGTLRAWWHLLPLLLGAWTLGWLGYQASLVVAASISKRWPWLALVVLSLGFVSLLSGTVVCLRFLGRELGIRDNLPEGAVEDDRDKSIGRMLAVTLLPFLGIYAAFGKVQETANEVVAYEIVTRGLFEGGVMSKLNPRTTHQVLVVLAVLVACYVLRRLVDLLHGATDFRPLGLVAALVEGFLMLLLVFTGLSLFRRFSDWLLDRRVTRWWQTGKEGWDTSLSSISHVIPTTLDQLWSWLTGAVWPLFLAALAEPVLWLAVAALVYGTHVLSFAEMWRKGEPLSVHLDNQRRIAGRRAAARQTTASGRGRALALELQELFFGDLDDKYLPTFQSLRLILRGGLVFLGAYVVVYTGFSTVSALLTEAVKRLVPPSDEVFWISWKLVFDLLTEPVGETLRLSLLAVAFGRALQLFKAGADPSAIGPSTGSATDLDRIAPLDEAGLAAVRR